jgi:hypothetical protein
VTVLILFAINLLALSAVVVLAVLFLRERARRKQRNMFGAWPIAAVSPERIDPAFLPGPFGPGRDTEVAFIGRGPYVVEGGTSDAEAWVLAVLARRARCLFEFGTCTGKTAYLWARNAPDDARVVTLTLAPGERAEYSASGKALRLVRPGGLVLWHDYAGPRHASGVYRALNELAARLPLSRIQGTTLVAYRRPAAG